MNNTSTIKTNGKYTIELDEATHIYIITDLETNQSWNAELSVTELQRELGLTPNYSNVDEEVLLNAAKRGTECHKALEELRTPNSNHSLLEYIDSPYYELIESAYNGLSKMNDLIPLALEQKIMWELADGRIVAGSIDELGIHKESEYLYILDNKFTYEIHDLQVQTQTEIYKAIVNQLVINNITINGFEFGLYEENLYGDFNGLEGPVDKRYVNHKGQVYELISGDASQEWAYDLLNQKVEAPKWLEKCYKKELLNGLELSQVNTLTLLAQEKELVKYENKVKEIKKLIAINRSKIQKAMEEQGIKSYELGNVKYTLVAPTKVSSFNVDKAKEFLTEQQVQSCYEIKEKAGYLRIKVNE